MEARACLYLGSHLKILFGDLLQLKLLLRTHNSMCRTTCSLQNIFELWLLVVHCLQIFDVLYLLLLSKLHINGIELLL